MLVLAEQNRAFGYAAAASVAVHALLLLMNLTPMHETLAPLPPPPLVAHIVEAAPSPAPSAPQRKEERQQKEKSEKAAEPKIPPLRKPVQKPRPKAVLRPSKPIVRAVPPPAAIEPRAEPDAQTAASAPPLPVAPAAPPPTLAAIAPPSAAPAPDPAEALASFRERIREAAGRYKRYPPVARDNGWTGDVIVRIQMAASGGIASIRVKTSSGYEVLDEQALEMFRKAVPAVPVPAALRGREFAVEVRAIYNLADRPG